MKSTIVGSAASLLFFFSIISYAQGFIQAPTRTQSPKQIESTIGSEQSRINQSNAADNLRAEELNEDGSSAPAVNPKQTAGNISGSRAAAQNYTATAYNLRGRTSSGSAPARGVIAADPAVLPLGTRVWVDAGAFSGEYIVGDTGGSVRGRRIDIWTPTANEARRFGRRMVKLTVLSLGAKRAKSGPNHPRTAGANHPKN